jgi:hypothetical protein
MQDFDDVIQRCFCTLQRPTRLRMNESNQSNESIIHSYSSISNQQSTVVTRNAAHRDLLEPEPKNDDDGDADARPPARPSRQQRQVHKSLSP